MKREIAELLTAAARDHDWTDPEPAVVRLARRLPPERVVAAAAQHRVVGCVAASLAGSDVPEELAAGLASHLRRSTGWAMLSTATLRTVRTTFGDDIPWLAIKGPVLDAALYPRPRLRSYRDLDVLVEPSRLADAVDALEGAGFRLADRNWRQIKERMVSQLHLERPGSAPIDLHWTLIFDEQRRRTFRLELEQMIARARTVEIAGGPVRTLDAADTLIYLCVHAAIEGGDRLVWLKDIDVAARLVQDWDEVVTRTKRYGVGLPVATMLARSRRTLAAPVPSKVVHALAPLTWRALAGAFDRGFPVAASTGLGSPATLLTRSAHRGTTASLLRAARGLLHRGRATVLERQLTRVDKRFDPTHEGSLLYPDGDHTDRDAYFERLAHM